jgi:hypothetical protein
MNFSLGDPNTLGDLDLKFGKIFGKAGKWFARAIPGAIGGFLVGNIPGAIAGATTGFIGGKPTKIFKRLTYGLGAGSLLSAATPGLMKAFPGSQMVANIASGVYRSPLGIGSAIANLTYPTFFSTPNAVTTISAAKTAGEQLLTKNTSNISATGPTEAPPVATTAPSASPLVEVGKAVLQIYSSAEQAKMMEEMAKASAGAGMAPDWIYSGMLNPNSQFDPSVAPGYGGGFPGYSDAGQRIPDMVEPYAAYPSGFPGYGLSPEETGAEAREIIPQEKPKIPWNWIALGGGGLILLILLTQPKRRK